MTRKKGRTVLVAALLCIGLALPTACGPSSQAPQLGKEGEREKSVQKQEQPKYGGTLRAVNSLVAPSFDLIAEGTNGTWLPTVPLYNSLLQYDILNHNGVPDKIIPDLAEKWDVSKDGLTYTFNLRKGVKFHDGAEFTSADAEYSLNRIMEPPPKTPSLRQGWYKGFITKMETPDRYTLVVHLKEPYVAFTKLIATTVTPMVPKHVLEPLNSRITETKHLVGTGPFKIVEGDRTVGYKFVKNQDYYRKDRPFLDAVDMPVILEETLRVAGFKAGKLDFLAEPPRVIEGLRRDMGDKVIISQTQNVTTASPIWFNEKRKPFEDVRVRRAIRLAIDWPAISKIALEGQACMGGFYAPAGEWGRPCEYWAQQPGFRTPTQEDTKEARRLLGDAGYPNGFDVTLHSGYDATHDRVGELLMPMLEKIGIRAKLRNFERTAYYNAMNNGDFELTSIGLGLNLDDPNDVVGTQFITGAGRNYGFFSDATVDDLYQKQSRAMDPNERKRLARQLEDRLVELAPAMPLPWPISASAHYPYMKGYKLVGNRGQEQRREEVWLDK